MKKALIMLAGGLLCSSLAQANTDNADLVAQAKKEGSVTFNVWYLQPQWRSFVKDFEQQYGVKVRIPEGSIDGNMNKLLAESGKAKGKIDVIALSVSQLQVTMGAKSLAKIDDLPGYGEAYHQIQNVDTQGYAVAFWGNQTGLVYDPQQMGDRPLPQTMEDLQRFIDANPKRFGYNDPNNGGAGEAFIQRVVKTQSGEFDSESDTVDAAVVKNWQKGWQWFAANNDKITRTASGADSLTRLNDGELMLTPAWEDHLVGLQKTGAITSRLKFYVPEFGMPGGGNVAAIAANSQHPAASRLFLNWLIQADTQKALSKAFGSTPMHKQVIPDVKRPDTEVQFYGKAYSMQMKKEFVRQVMMQ
ncbi:extracellular solute-binding protein [Klebsiella sp. RHBSTW-00484]|uniref:extracellular solute-binding protein n=1 Tax=unclassified Klebsiella TaxID=2608929 RepID=UPI0015E572DC|nr:MULTISPECIES: extracellular solute-binding protein [unclassified Klebsiella]MBA7844697.1 extracellular solute-binding protein [Klebsiella sp. RHBSTW-00465]QLO34620.1 extracellular solute-binding protein [Klebsiella sp. RHBSTW-00484]QLT74134.1 extracellular solute-binding protein [Klebsiella sp. RHBSTW-00464]